MTKANEFIFHGAFGTKTKARAKEKKVHGFIRKRRIRGKVRYIVMTKKRG